MLTISWILLSFVCGALPMSVWVGKAALGVDIREYGDGNPGATNVFRAGGRAWGIVALLLDFIKGAVPVGIANFSFGIEGLSLTVVALAPIVGHAYSPFLGWRGGKALAVTFGIWTGLSLFVVPILLGLSFAVWLMLLRPEGWAVVAGSLTLLFILLFLFWSLTWIATCVGMLLILAWTHGADLKQKPAIRPLSGSPG